MKYLLCFFSLIFIVFVSIIICNGQVTYKISEFHQTTENFKYLLLPNNAIAANDTINEKIVDLVNPVLLDSTIEKRKAHLSIFAIGWLMHAIGGYNWRAQSMIKQKFVGTVTRNTKSSHEKFTEYDINFDLNFHLRKYLLRQFESYDLQKSIGRQDYRRGTYLKNYSLPPFVRDTNNIDITQYRLHCELTPPKEFRNELNKKFYPTLPDGMGLKDHLNFQTPFPSMGFYGVTCLDCNHSCHPELHPYEWVWWLKATPEDSTTNKTWLVGLFHESSKRMKNWSKNPMTGSIAIPFVIKNATGYFSPLEINVEHLVFGKFEPVELNKISIAETAIPIANNYSEIIFQGNNFTIQIPTRINFSPEMKAGEIKYWFSNLNYDERQNILSGYFHFATSVEALYTTRITFLNE